MRLLNRPPAMAPTPKAPEQQAEGHGPTPYEISSNEGHESLDGAASQPEHERTG